VVKEKNQIIELTYTLYKEDTIDLVINFLMQNLDPVLWKVHRSTEVDFQLDF
jgi:hypothetical protein